MAPMKVQPIDIDPQRVKEAVVVRNDSAKPVLKSRLRRLFVFERQLPSVLRTSSSEKPIAGDGSKDGGAAAELEPSSVCLRNMVHNFMEESNEKQPPPPKCGRNRCNCFNANNDSSDDEEFDAFGGGGGGGAGFAESVTDAADLLKSLIPCASVAERNLLADTAKIVEKNSKVYKQKDDLRKIVTDGLSCLGYDSFICKSKWDKTSSCAAGEYEFIDVILEGERLIIDIDFRSEFEIARSTGTYKATLQSLPHIFVGKSDRLSQIVTIMSEAAKQSLRKKGMHVPPWRNADYMLAKWLSQSGARPKQPPSFCACSSIGIAAVPENLAPDGDDNDAATTESDCGELELIFGEKLSPPGPVAYSGETKAEPGVVEVPAWQPPVVKPKSVDRGAKVVPGLASLLNDKP